MTSIDDYPDDPEESDEEQLDTRIYSRPPLVPYISEVDEWGEEWEDDDEWKNYEDDPDDPEEEDEEDQDEEDWSDLDEDADVEDDEWATDDYDDGDIGEQIDSNEEDDEEEDSDDSDEEELPKKKQKKLTHMICPERMKDYCERAEKEAKLHDGVIIQLSGAQGGLTVVDKKTYKKYGHLKMWIKYNNSGEKGRPTVSLKYNGFNILLSRLIMNADPNTPDVPVDHIDSNPLNNLTSNLRITTTLLNGGNRVKEAGKYSSDYHGVKLDKGRYQVEVKFNYKMYNLGICDDEIIAAERYDTFLCQQGWNHKPLNFPHLRDEYMEREVVEVVKRNMPASGYYGVIKIRGGFQARIVHQKRLRILGEGTAEECARIRDGYVVRKEIPMKELNFPDEHLNYNRACRVKILCEDYPEDEDAVILIIAGRKEAILDRADYEQIKFYGMQKSHGYIDITVGIHVKRLARYLLEVTDRKVFVDHINHNKVDNRRCNLRLSNAQLNSQNRAKAKGTSSKYVGVHKDKTGKRWVCAVVRNSKKVFSGIHDREDYVARRRDLYILEHFREEHYMLSFEWTEEEIVQWTEVFYQEKLSYKKPGGSSQRFINVMKEKKYDRWKSLITVYRPPIIKGKRMPGKCKIVSFTDKDEELAAMKRDVFIYKAGLVGLTHKPNFKWEPENLDHWANVFKNLPQMKAMRATLEYMNKMIEQEPKAKKKFIKDLEKKAEVLAKKKKIKKTPSKSMK